MEIKETNYKRFIPSEGKALRWSQYDYDYLTKKKSVFEHCTTEEALIDVNQLSSEVVEIEMSEYEEFTKDRCLGIASASE